MDDNNKSIIGIKLHNAMASLYDGDYFSDSDVSPDLKLAAKNFIEAVKLANESIEGKVVFQKMFDDVELPSRATAGDAGMDIKHYIHNAVYMQHGGTPCTILQAGETKLLTTGVKCALSEGDHFAVVPKSGNSFKTELVIKNAPGTIDCGYRDEIKIIVKNTGTEPMYIDNGKAVAQLILVRGYINLDVTEVEDINSIDGNRGGGFGSTGRGVSDK